MKPTPPPGQTVRRRTVVRTLGLILAWILGIPAVLAILVYIALIIHPIPLPFLSSEVRNAVVASMPAGTELELGDMALAIEGFAQPVIKFSPVTYHDTTTGARIQMDALEVGFSLVHALFGQPGAKVTVVGPHLQVNQDLFGPRLADFEIVPDPNGGPDTVRVLEGSTAFPEGGIHAKGVDISGGNHVKVRSDNDWLIYNLEAAQKSIASVLEQAKLGRFSRMTVKKGTLDMNDALYGVFRTFKDLTLDIAPTPNGKAVEGSFSANFAGTVMHGNIERVIDEKGDARLKVSMTNFDLSSFVPNINDPDSQMGITGAAQVSIDIGFDAPTGTIKEGQFRIDMTGTSMRIGTDYFPVASNIIELDWAPKTGTFTMDDAAISIGPSSAHVSGVYVLGLDDLYGPIAAISMTAHDVKIGSTELGDPAVPFDTISFKGWEAPLYGAIGIDDAVVTKPGGTRIESKGRIDMLRKGLGIDMSITGEGIAAEDMKRLWPYFIARPARDWFVKSVTDGKIETVTMKYDFPVGTLGLNDESKPIPQNGVFVEMVADGVKVKPLATMAPIEIQGKTRMQMHDSEFTLSGDGGIIPTDKGNIQVANAALVMTPGENAGESIVEISGDLNAGIPAITSIANQVQPGLLKSANLPLDVSALTGDLNVRLVSTTTLDSKGASKAQQYSVNGNVQDFGSTTPIQGHSIGNGQLTFMATQDGFKVGGQAQFDGVDTSLAVNGDMSNGATTPALTVNATVDLGDLKKLGFDASQIGTGKVALLAKPNKDNTLDVSLDLKNAALNIQDLGITKDAGVPGQLTATISQKGDVTDINDVDLGFGDVKLKGGLEFDSKKGLQSAEISSFALSPGDAAQISLTPINGGYQVRIRGDQLDLKPMLKRFFNLNNGSGGPAATTFTQTLAVDAQLKRALGFYKTTAYNVNLDLALKGSDIKKVGLQAQLGGTSSLSVVTNPTSDGQTMVVVFNDLGSLLRLVGVYPQVEGGEGSFTLAQNPSTKVDLGTVSLKNFAIVDEKNVAEIVDSHAASRAMLAQDNKLQISNALVHFTRRSDRIQINDGLVAGPTVGGTAEGFIYTDSKQYDIAGTYIPMFGLNNAFGRLFGPFGGGANGGLFGITFHVSGPLDKPQFAVNPMSALAWGPFRSLFEFQTKEQPRTDGSDITDNGDNTSDSPN